MGTLELVSKELNYLGGHFACLCRGFDFYEVKTFFLHSRHVYLLAVNVKSCFGHGKQLLNSPTSSFLLASIV